MLNEEEREDTELRNRFKEKWRREPSSKLTETLRKDVRSQQLIVTILFILMVMQVKKFKGILDNATRADSIVKERYQSNREAMILLGKPEPEITAALPAAGSHAAISSGSQVKNGNAW